VGDDRAVGREVHNDTTMTDEFICFVYDLALAKAPLHVEHAEVMARPRMPTEDLQSHRVGCHWCNFEPTGIDSWRKYVACAVGVRSHYVMCGRRCRALGPKSAGDYEKQSHFVHRELIDHY
jgi:hypothetical protein